MPKKIYRQGFRGRSFRGQDLANIDFSDADIRGTDFSEAKLNSANFSDAKAGLQLQWLIGLVLLCLSISALSGYISAYSIGFSSNFLIPGATEDPKADPGIQGIIFSSIVLLLLGYTLFRVIRPGTKLETVIVSLIVTSTAVSVVAATDESLGRIAVLAIISLFAVVGAITGATLWILAWAIAVSIIGRLGVLITVLGAFVGNLVGIFHGLRNLEDFKPGMFPIILSIVGTIILVLFLFSIYIGNQILSGNEKYALLRTLSVLLTTEKGTCFKNADLTDANFINASLEHTDLRSEKLIRTCWRNAKNLNQALTIGTYLENLKIRELVTTGKSKDKKFEYIGGLQGLNLQSTNLRGFSFMGSNLSEANLREADLSNANFKQTQLYGAYLSFATLTGACIEDWGISPTTLLEEIKCDYVFMRQATEDKRDPWRKPDNWQEDFPKGGFSTFIAPIITTLDAYNPQKRGLYELDQSFKPLDLYHYDGVDPAAVVVAIKQLQDEYPEAELEIVALYGPSKNKLRIEARVSDDADAAKLNAKYQDKYRKNQQSPSSDIQTLLARIEEEDPQAPLLRRSLEDSRNSVKFLTVIQHVENFHGVGDRMSEIKVDSGGGSVSGIVGGDIRGVIGVVNLGEISGDVSNAIGCLPDSQDDKPGLKERLTELKEVIESETALSPEDKVEALEQVKALAEAGKKPEDGVLKKTAKTAVKILRGTVANLPDTAKLAEACSKLLPIIISLLALT